MESKRKSRREGEERGERREERGERREQPNERGNKRRAFFICCLYVEGLGGSILSSDLPGGTGEKGKLDLPRPQRPLQYTTVQQS
jgi:hypothetical protein